MDKERFKQMAAEKAVEEIQSGAIVGLGTGSTVYYVLLALGKKVRDGLNIIGIATSKADGNDFRQAGNSSLNAGETPCD